MTFVLTTVSILEEMLSSTSYLIPLITYFVTCSIPECNAWDSIRIGINVHLIALVQSSSCFVDESTFLPIARRVLVIVLARSIQRDVIQFIIS